MAQIEKRKQYWRQFREPEEEFKVDDERGEVGAGEDILTGCEITAAPKNLQEERKDLEYPGAKCPKNSNRYLKGQNIPILSEIPKIQNSHNDSEKSPNIQNLGGQLTQTCDNNYISGQINVTQTDEMTQNQIVTQTCEMTQAGEIFKKTRNVVKNKVESTVTDISKKCDMTQKYKVTQTVDNYTVTQTDKNTKIVTQTDEKLLKSSPNKEDLSCLTSDKITIEFMGVN